MPNKVRAHPQTIVTPLDRVPRQLLVLARHPRADEVAKKPRKLSVTLLRQMDRKVVP